MKSEYMQSLVNKEMDLVPSRDVENHRRVEPLRSLQEIGAASPPCSHPAENKIKVL
ncbi:hypothetical protein ACFQ4Y_13980 [Kroppenstedtia sanguinis]|uniref:Uncharacterized protein n=1 Tax=Kroppenstedtia sanguinis TaxID=1380684 RepID=A0ABW4CEP7_9BACL